MNIGEATGIEIIGTVSAGAMDAKASEGIFVNATSYGISATLEAAASATSTGVAPSLLLAITQLNPPAPPPIDPNGLGKGSLQPTIATNAPPPPPAASNQPSQPLSPLGGGDNGATSTTLTNVVDIDQGAQIFASIAPTGRGTGDSSPGAASGPSPAAATSTGGAGTPPAPAGGATAAGASSVGAGSGNGFGGIGTTSAGAGAFTDPLTIVAPVHAAPQASPLPPAPDEPVGGRGSGIFQARPFVVPPRGVPGIDEPAITGGNRALWFGRAAP